MRKGQYAKAPSNDGEPRPLPSGEFAGLPLLWEMLVHCRNDDGSPRKRGSVTLFFEDGFWKACLSNKDDGLVAFSSAASVLEVAQALERGLDLHTLDWRVSGQAPPKRK